MPLLCEIAPIGVMPRRVEIRPGNSMAARNMFRLPRAPEDIGHRTKVILKDNPMQSHGVRQATAEALAAAFVGS